MNLSVPEHSESIQRLIETVLPTQPLHLDWQAEIERQLVDLDSGRTQTIAAARALAEMRAMIQAPSPGKPDA